MEILHKPNTGQAYGKRAFSLAQILVPPPSQHLECSIYTQYLGGQAYPRYMALSVTL